MTWLPMIGVAASVLYLMLLFTKYAASRRYLVQSRESPDGDAAREPVDVLQPILSGDPLLEATLRRNLETADEASARHLLLIDEDDAEAKEIAERLASEFAARAVVVECPPPSANKNPKAVKLDRGLTGVQSEFTAVLDDDTWLPRDNLAVARRQLDSCDVYTGLPCYLGTGGFWSGLVAHFVNNNSVLTYLPLLPFAEPLSINGMFYVLRTDTVRRLGGWSSIDEQLCDDYAFARLARDAGLRIRQGVTPQFLHTTVRSAGEYLRLMHRWFLFADILMSDQSVRMKMLLVVLLGIPPLLFWIALFAVLGGWMGIAVWLTMLVLRHVLIRDLLRRVCGPEPPLNLVLSPCCELLQPFHWLHALLRREIQWRSRRIRVSPGGGLAYRD